MKRFLTFGIFVAGLGVRASAAPIMPAPELPALDISAIKRIAAESVEVSTPPSRLAPAPNDTAPNLPPGMPRLIGKWMIDKDGDIAHWLGDRLDGKQLREPINVIVRVAAETPEDATAKLIAAMKNAGFASRWGHSDGYRAILDDAASENGAAPTLVPQLPAPPLYAFTDDELVFPNNHLRLFQPVRAAGRYFFIGAISKENVILLPYKPYLKHPYASFTSARDLFADRMRTMGGATLLPDVPLDNAISPTDPDLTTGDHDGKAVVIDLP